MAARDSAMELLAQGLSASQVANTLSVSESYISQLLSDEDFAAELQGKRIAASQENLDYDKKLAKIEEGFLERMEEKLPFANLGQSMQAFKIVNAAKRRREVLQEIVNVSVGQVVNITLPAMVIPKYITNSNSEIIEVEGQTMISATPRGLDDIVTVRKEAARMALGIPAKVEPLPKQLALAGLERAQEILDSVRPVVRRTRKVPDHLNVELL